MIRCSIVHVIPTLHPIFTPHAPRLFSFRNAGEILQLCGCDRLTISPSLLTELEALPAAGVIPLLSPGACTKEPDVDTSEAGFRWAMNEDAMATEKLAEGIRGFARDLEKLEEVIKGKM